MFTKEINQDFFKNWSSNMAYVLGYITADGCIVFRKDRKKNPYILDITSVDLEHLKKIKNVLNSGYKIGKKSGSYAEKTCYRFQASNPVITNDLIKIGITPKKTFRLRPLKIPNKYFSDFIRGFFDGDGSVYIYKVNKTSQIKASFVASSLPFIANLNQRLCKNLKIPIKSIQQDKSEFRKGKILYAICFYINDCAKLYKFMYENKPELYLERKYQIFKEWETTEKRHYKKQNYPSKIGWRLNKKLCSQIQKLI